MVVTFSVKDQETRITINLHKICLVDNNNRYYVCLYNTKFRDYEITLETYNTLRKEMERTSKW